MIYCKYPTLGSRVKSPYERFFILIFLSLQAFDIQKSYNQIFDKLREIWILWRQKADTMKQVGCQAESKKGTAGRICGGEDGGGRVQVHSQRKEFFFLFEEKGKEGSIWKNDFFWGERKQEIFGEKNIFFAKEKTNGLKEENI